MKNKLIIFYVFAFAVSWTLWYFMYLRYTEVGSMDLIVFAFSIGGAGPIISLVILEKISKKEIVVDEILNTIRLKDTQKRWFILTVFAYPLILIAFNYRASCVWHKRVAPSSKAWGWLAPLYVKHDF